MELFENTQLNRKNKRKTIKTPADFEIVFGRWFLWLAIMIALNNLYSWGIHYSDNSKEIEMQQNQNDRIRKAREYIYSTNNKETKKLMKKAYINSVKSKY